MRRAHLDCTLLQLSMPPTPLSPSLGTFERWYGHTIWDARQLCRNNTARRRGFDDAAAPEMRVDHTDGGSYTQAEFAGLYGGLVEWDAAAAQAQPAKLLTLEPQS